MIRLSHSELHPIPLPDGHRFPIRKYALVREQLEYEGVIQKAQLFAPEFVDDAVITLTHCPEFWARAKALQLSDAEIRRIGFPGSEALITRSISSASGTLRAAVNALEDGAGLNLAGGTHHAFFDRGEGFCLLNDIALAANYLLAQGLVQKVLIVDLDVHQGNGTAALFEGRPEVFTFSMHCRENYPFRKSQSDLDVELEAGTRDRAYLDRLRRELPDLLDGFGPDIVFYQAGVDVLAGDRLGKLSLSMEGCRERDRFTVGECHRRGLPLVTVMGGGYGDLNLIVKAHSNTFKTVLEYYETRIYTFS